MAREEANFTEDGILVTPGGPISGREAIEKHYADDFKQGFHSSNNIATPDEDSPHIIGTAGNEGFSQQSCHQGPFGLRSSRVSILSSKRPYGLTCSQISGVRARRSVVVNRSAQCGRESTCCIIRVLI
jgi:hypothetical protein